MKSLAKSIISSSGMMIIFILYAHKFMIGDIVRNDDYEMLWKGFTQQGRSILLLNILYCIILVPVLLNFWEKTLLPIIEILFLKNVVTKNVTFVVCNSVESFEYFPWTTITKVRLPGERGVFVLPCKIDTSLCNSKVSVKYLPRSGLILYVYST